MQTLNNVSAQPLEKSVYGNPTKRLFGNGSFEKLPFLLESFRVRNILLVLGEKSFRSSAYYSRLQEILAPYHVMSAEAVSPNPTAAFAQEGINRLKSLSFDLVLAVGGGSVLDMAKIFAALPKQTDTNLENYIERRTAIAAKPVPLIAIPTTSGTGSEVTPTASLETRDKKKISMDNPMFYPTIALIDPELTYSMPAYVTASTGFDALSQAVESFWSVRATPFSQTHSLRALELIAGNFEKAYHFPDDPDSRSAMALASCEAGLAIAQTKTTAVHSVSYPITAHFGVAHGHACALTLAPFVRFNAPVMKESGRRMMKIFEAVDYEAMARWIEGLMQAMHLKNSLLNFGIDEKGREVIIRDGFRPDRMLNNPRQVSADDLRAILNSVA